MARVAHIVLPIELIPDASYFAPGMMRASSPAAKARRRAHCSHVTMGRIHDRHGMPMHLQQANIARAKVGWLPKRLIWINAPKPS
jgi:hypothetical protein